MGKVRNVSSLGAGCVVTYFWCEFGAEVALEKAWNSFVGFGKIQLNE
jgi:hypothetical protein